MLPGCPSVYYGDEAGMEGYKDPFNRRPYPWGREDEQMLNHYRRLGQLRKSQEALRLGDISFFYSEDRKLGFQRQYQGKKLRIYANRSRNTWEIPVDGNMLLGHNIRTVASGWLTLHPMGFCVMEAE
jgi:glycosidase